MAPSLSVTNFEYHLKHHRGAQGQAGYSYDGPYRHLVLSKYIPENLRRCIGNDGLVVEVSERSHVDLHANDLRHAIQ